MFELYLGFTLFQTHDNREHLAMMEKILARPIPDHLARRSKAKTNFFSSSTNRLRWDPAAPEARYTNTNCKVLYAYERASRHTPRGREELVMYDLVAAMCDYDPATRITLREALRHVYFENRVVKDATTHVLRLQI